MMVDLIDSNTMNSYPIRYDSHPPRGGGMNGGMYGNKGHHPQYSRNIPPRAYVNDAHYGYEYPVRYRYSHEVQYSSPSMDSRRFELPMQRPSRRVHNPNPRNHSYYDAGEF